VETINVLGLQSVKEQTVCLNQKMLHMHVINDAFYPVDLEKWLSSVKRQNAVWVLPTKPVQGIHVVADRSWQMIVNFGIWEIWVNIFHCLAKTVGALKVAFGCQYYVEEREGLPLP
jgi:hypothetical protein